MEKTGFNILRCFLWRSPGSIVRERDNVGVVRARTQCCKQPGAEAETVEPSKSQMIPMVDQTNRIDKLEAV